MILFLLGCAPSLFDRADSAMSELGYRQQLSSTEAELRAGPTPTAIHNLPADMTDGHGGTWRFTSRDGAVYLKIRDDQHSDIPMSFVAYGYSNSTIASDELPRLEAWAEPGGPVCQTEQFSSYVLKVCTVPLGGYVNRDEPAKLIRALR